MKVTVCQFSGENARIDEEWAGLLKHVREMNSDLVLLPEMPFYSWITALPKVNLELWEEAVETHQVWLHRLAELGSRIVIGTCPIIKDHGERYNVAFICQDSDIQFSHTKFYLPNEPGFWEETWYQRGKKDFSYEEVDGIRLGFLICTELWFMEHAREYAEQGIHLLICPRSTPEETTDKWIIGGRTAAVISGAYCISSNHHGIAADDKTFLGGAGWICDPEGNLLGRTSDDQPFLTISIDVKIAEEAKMTYPRYVTR
ncbi:MAG: carbon-nitrogen hydrolase family protein [Candidatus Kariarchaeaceae archaeon]|jgi:N-carbamoylputrescine amidase